MAAAFASAAALLTGLPALAADLGVAPVLKAPPPPMFTWTGFYIGGNIGGKWAQTSGTIDIAPATGGSGTFGGFSEHLGAVDAGTFLGGGQVGYNWQSGQVVYGLEGDFDAQRWSATRTQATFNIGTIFVPGDSYTADSRWQASFRGRVGYAWDRLLVYTTAGVAFTEVRVGTNFIPFTGTPGTSATDNPTILGATFGLGLEYAVWNNVSLGIEGRYTAYATHTYNGGTILLGAAPFTASPVTQTLHLDTLEVLGKLNYRFWTAAY
jgi:outer membrane immunogenic protein